MVWDETVGGVDGRHLQSRNTHSKAESIIGSSAAVQEAAASVSTATPSPAHRARTPPPWCNFNLKSELGGERKRS